MTADAGTFGGAEVFKLFGVIEVGRQRFVSDMAAMEKQVKDFSLNLKQGFTKAEDLITRNAGDIRKVGVAFSAVGAAGLLMGKQLISSAGEMERYQAEFEVLMGSAAGAKQRLAELTTFAAQTPFSLPQIIEADRLVLAYKLDLGGLDKTLRTFGDTAAGMGVPMEQVIGAFAKLKAGMFTVQEMAPLGITRERLAELGVEFTKTGEIVNREDLFPAAIKLIERFAGTMEKVSLTTEGRVTNMGDAFFQLKATFGKTITPMFKEYVENLTEAMGKMQKWAEENPKLAASLTKLAMGASVFFVALGPILIALPSLVKGSQMAWAGLIKLKGAMSTTSGMGVAGITFVVLGLAAAALQADKNMEKMRIEIERVEEKARKAGLEIQRLPEALKLSWFQEWSQAASDLVGMEQEATKLRREYLFMMEAEADMMTERKKKKEQEAASATQAIDVEKQKREQLAKAEGEALEERRRNYSEAASAILSNWQTLLSGMREGNRLTTSEFVAQLAQMLQMIDSVNRQRGEAGLSPLFSTERLDIMRQMQEAQVALTKEQEEAESKLAEERKSWGEVELAQRQKLYEYDRQMLDLTFQHKRDLQDIVDSEDQEAKNQILQEELRALQQRREQNDLDAQSRLESLQRERDIVKELVAAESMKQEEAKSALTDIFDQTVKAQEEIRGNEEKLFETRKAEHEKTMAEITTQAETLRSELAKTTTIVGDHIGDILKVLEKGLMGVVSRVSLGGESRPLLNEKGEAVGSKSVIINIDGRRVETEPNVQAILDAAAQALEREYTHGRG